MKDHNKDFREYQEEGKRAARIWKLEQRRKGKRVSRKRKPHPATTRRFLEDMAEARKQEIAQTIMSHVIPGWGK